MSLENNFYSIQEVRIESFFSKDNNEDYSIFKNILNKDLIGNFSYALIKNKKSPVALLKYEKTVHGGEIVSLTEKTFVHSLKNKKEYNNLIRDFLKEQIDFSGFQMLN